MEASRSVNRCFVALMGEGEATILAVIRWFSLKILAKRYGHGFLRGMEHPWVGNECAMQGRIANFLFCIEVSYKI
jgi:hypothetical protein